MHCRDKFRLPKRAMGTPLIQIISVMVMAFSAESNADGFINDVYNQLVECSRWYKNELPTNSSQHFSCVARALLFQLKLNTLTHTQTELRTWFTISAMFVFLDDWLSWKCRESIWVNTDGELSLRVTFCERVMLKYLRCIMCNHNFPRPAIAGMETLCGIWFNSSFFLVARGHSWDLTHIYFTPQLSGRVSVYTHFLSSAVSFINRIPAAKMRASATSAPRTILASIWARSLRLSRATTINVSVQRVAFCN